MLPDFAIQLVEGLAAMPHGFVLAAAVLGLLTAVLVGLSVPGTIVPLSPSQ